MIHGFFLFDFDGSGLGGKSCFADIFDKVSDMLKLSDIKLELSDMLRVLSDIKLKLSDMSRVLSDIVAENCRICCGLPVVLGMDSVFRLVSSIGSGFDWMFCA